jgi:hypothetical protein
MIDEPKKSQGPRVGEKAPEFLIETPDGRSPLSQLAAHHEKLILTSQDSTVITRTEPPAWLLR